MPRMEAYRLKPDEAACRFMEGEAVLLNVTTSAYYSLNATGAYVLRELLVSNRTLDDLATQLQTTADGQAVRKDLQQLIQQLIEEGLLESSTAPPVGESYAELPLPTPYQTPTLEKHGELEQLILSGE